MVIIKTKYLSPTSTKGGRIKAIANGFTATIQYPHYESYELAHYEAIKALVYENNLDWDITNMGYGSDNEGYYFTFSSSVINQEA